MTKTIRTLSLIAVGLLGANAFAAEGYFGAQLADHESNGAEIVALLPDSPAANAGFREGDHITGAGGTEIDNAETLAAQLRSFGANRTIEVRYIRGGVEQQAQLTLGRNPWQNANQPDDDPDLHTVQIRIDIAYAGTADEKQRLDLYLPQSDVAVPGMLWIHGGGWSTGDRANERALALRFAERGIAVAAISYRLSAGDWADPSLPSEGVQHPAHAQDAAAAFSWLHDNAEALGINPNALYVSGHSSGGHLAALLATDKRYLSHHGLRTSALAGALPVGGAYDIADYHAALTQGDDPAMGEAHIRAVFGTTEQEWLDASPTQFVGETRIPMLVVVEEQDAFERYADRLRSAAATAGRSNVEFYQAQGRRHGNVVLLMSGRHADSVRARMLRFMEANASPVS